MGDWKRPEEPAVLRVEEGWGTWGVSYENGVVGSSRLTQ